MTATDYFITFATSAILGLILTPMAIGMAVRWRIAEKPNGRTGRGEIAHIGGVAIIGAIIFSLIPVFLFFLPHHPVNRAFLPVMIASGFLIFLLGIIDDLRSFTIFISFSFRSRFLYSSPPVGLGLLEHFGLVDLSMTTAVVASW